MEHEPAFDRTEHPPADSPQSINALICALIAKELDVIRGKLEDMGENLCNEPIFVTQYCDTLQSIDELSQRHENLARLLRSDDMEAAIDSITLESLRNRLLDAATSQLALIGERSDGAGSSWHAM